MTKDEFLDFAIARHGPSFLKPLAEETGYSFSHLWRIAAGKRAVNRRLEKQLASLPPVLRLKSAQANTSGAK